MSKVILIFAVLSLFSIASAATNEEVSTLWGAWKTAHNKRYLPSEENHRFMVFQQNVAKVAKLNAEYIDAKFAINQFSDLTSEEFKQKYTSEVAPSQVSNEELQIPPIPEFPPFPASFDWRTKNAVSYVKNQQLCGACWAFTVTSALESLNIIANNTRVVLSEQQMVDCGNVVGLKGCQGGKLDLAFDYARKYGLTYETDYPYIAAEKGCRYQSWMNRTVLSSWQSIPGKQSDALKYYVMTNPIAVYLRGDSDVFRYYSSGVITKGCGAKINHSGLVVGYQKVGKKEAFIVKNSWGVDWGMKGYVYISTNETYNNGVGACGILTPFPIYPSYRR